MDVRLGRLERINPRQAWQNEAQDFTPWLAEPENFQTLCDCLHLFDAEVLETEYSVGNFSADIVARDRDGQILIENQLEQTDHGHLGQILTYLAGLEEKAKVVWIATRFREEHRAAIDWLNDNTNENFEFFGIEIELIQIGDSQMAPQFHVVSKPNEWTRHLERRRHAINASATTDKQKFYRGYWTALSEFARTQGSSEFAGTPPKDYWWSFGAGRTGFGYSVTAGGRDKWIAVELVIGEDAENRIIDSLMSDKSEIERELGVQPVWDRVEGRKMSKVLIKRDNVDPMDQEQWSGFFRWYLEHIGLFRRVFTERIRQIEIDRF